MPRPTTVHPHGCGENHVLGGAVPHGRGSSPRVWGKLIGFAGNGAPLRFIPTGVGKTARQLILFDFLAGSSPRVWGKQKPIRHSDLYERFIPTGVGKTVDGGYETVCNPVHPHGCGENRVNGYIRGGYGGSSPRVWGKLFV